MEALRKAALSNRLFLLSNAGKRTPNDHRAFVEVIGAVNPPSSSLPEDVRTLKRLARLGGKGQSSPVALDAVKALGLLATEATRPGQIDEVLKALRNIDQAAPSAEVQKAARAAVTAAEAHQYVLRNATRIVFQLGPSAQFGLSGLDEQKQFSRLTYSPTGGTNLTVLRVGGQFVEFMRAMTARARIASAFGPTGAIRTSSSARSSKSSAVTRRNSTAVSSVT